MPTDPNFDARSQKLKVFDLQDETAFDNSDLNGKTQLISNFDTIWLWFIPGGSYDGTVNFEISPDGGVTWFPVQGFQPNAQSTLATNVASPTTSISFMIHVPDYSHFRARMSGGSQGTLTVKARLIDFDVTGG